MKCPCCGAAELISDTRDVEYIRKDKTVVVIPNVSGEFCPACGEIILDKEQGERYMALIRTPQQED